jgi:hypothetical protein
MRRKSRSSSAAAEQTAEQAPDSLDALNWDLLQESVIAAHRGDPEGHVAPLLRLEAEAPADSRAARMCGTCSDIG